jgi:LacI family transcriptional regulator
MRNNVTTYDIAQMAGISQTTVSKILNNKGDMISSETRERVQKIMLELNYKPNFMARALKTGKTESIGVMGSLTLANFDSPYFSGLVSSMEESLSRHTSQYSLNIFGANYHGHSGLETFEKSAELVRKGMVDGLIFIILAFDLKNFEKTMKPVLDELQLPFVVIHSTSRKLGYNNVGVDSFHGGYLAGQHLASLGHKEIWLYEIETELYSPQYIEVKEGFRKALADYGVNWNEQMVIKHIKSKDKAGIYQEAYQTILKTEKIPPAMFVYIDDAAVGVLHALEERGIRVPEDTAIVSIDSAKPNQYYETTLTSVRHPVQQKAETAVTMLFDVLEGRKKREIVQHTIIKPWLEVRKSCGAK